MKIAIAVSRFNQPVIEPLLQGALSALEDRGIKDSDIDIVEVPGAFELPLAAQRLAALDQYSGIIALGAVIRGETPHFDYVSEACAAGLMQVSLTQDIPVMFGVLTTDTAEQAFDRVGGKKGNKGTDAAVALLDFLDALYDIE